MANRLILIFILILCLALFATQWGQQIRRVSHGKHQPLTKLEAVGNWGLIVMACLAIIGICVSNHHPAPAHHQAVAQSKTIKHQKTTSKQSSSAATSSSSSASSSSAASSSQQQGVQSNNNAPGPEVKQAQLNQGKAIINFTVPANNQLQIVEGDNGNVLQTFTPQGKQSTVNYTFTKEGNYYLILTQGQQVKTTAYNISK